MVKIHLGCGYAIKDGWRNFDLFPGPGGIKHDLTKPFPNIQNNSVDFAFTEHFLEHLTLAQGKAMLKNVYNVLLPGGVLRISVPNLEVVIQDYLDGYITRIKEVWQPRTPCQMVNEAMREWGHQFLYDRRELHLALEEVGFTEIHDCNWRESVYPELRNQEIRPFHEEIIVEAVK